MSTKPIIHVHYIDDDYAAWNGPAVLDKYLQAAPGRIIYDRNGNETLDVLSVTSDEMVLKMDGKSKALHPGETITLQYEVPGLIADGSGWEYYTATIHWLTDEEAAEVTAEPMNKAIGMRLKKADGTEEPYQSKLFGTPYVSEKLWEKLTGELLYLGQINLRQLAQECPTQSLPDNGNLCFFLEMDGDRIVRPRVIRDFNPEILIVDMNADYPGLEDPLMIEFYETEQNAPGCKLLGDPADDPYGDSAPTLLFQYDPMDEGCNFLSHRDGYLYFFMGSDLDRFTDVTLQEEFS